MNRFKDLYVALEFLNRPNFKSISANLSSFIDVLISDYLQSEGYPKAISTLMNLKLTHSLLKNRSWCHSKQFQTILMKDFADYFGVRADFCEKLIGKVCNELGSLLDEEKSNVDDRYFEFLFVTIATSTNLDILTEDLGVGKSIIKNIKKSAQLVFSKGQSSENDPIQKAITDIVLKYATKMKSIPWAMDVARLEFILPRSAERWPILGTEAGRNIIFNVLMNISEHQRVKGSQVSQVLMDQVQQYAPEYLAEQIPDCESLITLLENSHLIYPETARKTKKTSFYCLAELGFELTSSAYAYENKLDIEQNPYRILEIEEPYQCHLLKLMNKETLIRLADILDKDYALSREAIKIFSERMIFIGENTRLADILSQWMTLHPSYWIREAAVASIALLKSTDKIRLSLEDVAKSDPSCAVQNKAIEILMRQ